MGVSHGIPLPDAQAAGAVASVNNAVVKALLGRGTRQRSNITFIGVYISWLDAAASGFVHFIKVGGISQVEQACTARIVFGASIR
jgi:hypothetical protein